MKILAILGILFLATAVQADIVYLDDGTHVEGRLTKLSDGWSIALPDGTIVKVKSENVTSIVAARVASPSEAMDRLASLRRAVDHMSDLKQIIDRYNKFLLQSNDRSANDDAKKDLAGWQQCLDQGLVKLGSQWITQQERDRVRQTAGAQATAARDLLIQNQNKDALAALQQAVTSDPENPLALYLEGVALYRLNQVTPARKAFEAANEFQPRDGATLNNLAVICWREKSYVAAINYYDQAMTVRPVDKRILDNMAQALHALPDANKKAPAVLHAMKDFQDQDSLFQQMQSKDGMFRWGSTWVTSQQLTELKESEAKVQDQINQLSHDFDALQQKVGEIDGEIDRNTREMHRLAASVTYVDANGMNVQMQLPQAFYDLQADNENLAKNKKTLQNQQESLRVRAREMQTKLPTAKFFDDPTIFGAEAGPSSEAPAAPVSPGTINTPGAINSPNPGATPPKTNSSDGSSTSGAPIPPGAPFQSTTPDGKSPDGKTPAWGSSAATQP
jgi:tetratricopeptide (TPR) repeat protein